MSAPIPQTHTLNFFGFLTESKRIINAHSRHFLALSVIFLLPISFSLIIYPTLHQSINHNDSIIFYTSKFIRVNPTRPDDEIDPRSLIFPLVYSLCVFLFSLFAVGTISYSTFHGFFGRPVKIGSSFKAILYFFLPMISTFVVAKVVIFMIALLFALVGASVLKVLELVGVRVDYDSDYFFAAAIVCAVVYGVVVLVLHVNWLLAPVISVVESRWGFGPLSRSASLVKGMRGVALLMLLFFGLMIGALVVSGSTFLLREGFASGWWSWEVILMVVICVGFATVLMLHAVAATVVLYMYCKALHGELAFEIAEEFSRDYVSLPFDDEKVPHVVYVV